MSTASVVLTKDKIDDIQGPILVLGASGFVVNPFRTLLLRRDDVYGTASRTPAWRLQDIDRRNVMVTDLLVDSNLDAMLDYVKARTIFDCVAYGAYSFETDSNLIYRRTSTYVSPPRPSRTPRDFRLHPCRNSSEYGDNASGPGEDAVRHPPNSHYAVSKVAAANLIHLYGGSGRFPCCNLRLYSVLWPDGGFLAADPKCCAGSEWRRPIS